MKCSYFGDPNAAQLRAHDVRSLEDRVKVLRALANTPRGGIRNPEMLRIARLATQGCKARDDECELRAIFDFVVKNVRYTGDVRGKDTFASALWTLRMGGEDCDGHSVLNAVLALDNGFRARWRITSNTGATWDHIYCQAATPKHRPAMWVTLDTTLGPNRFNTEPPHAKHKDFLVLTDE